MSGILKLMEVFDAVRTVLAVREYSDKPVPPETIRRIVEAAHVTASSMNGQPWHFIVIQDREMLKALGAAAPTGPYTAQAAFAVVVAMEESRFAVSDASRAIQSMVLVAWSEGVGSNFVGFSGMPAVNALLGIPKEIEVFAILPFGYPKNPVGKGKKQRKPFGEVVHRDHFGQPFKA